MNKEKEEFLKLLAKRRNEGTTPEEEAFIDAYYHMFDVYPDVLQTLSPSEKAALKSSIREGIILEATSGIAKQKAGLRFYKWQYISAAACILIISFSMLLYRTKSPEVKHSTVVAAQVKDIPPGSNKAILTLANGSRVVLNDRDDEEKIYKLVDTTLQSAAAYNSITTPRGGQYQLNLPDGSKVWLNSASSIRFPSAFNGEIRRVEMTGEVYFEIAKKSKPFIVSTGGQEVQVLGTHFNINAYADEENIKTTLLEGSVKVIGSDHQPHFLIPGQQSLVSSSGQFKTITAADTEMAVAWKNGYFKFDRQSLQSIMRQISRWYDVEITYVGEISADEYVGKIKRSEHISGVLKILKLSHIDFQLEGRKIIVNN